MFVLYSYYRDIVCFYASSCGCKYLEYIVYKASDSAACIHPECM